MLGAVPEDVKETRRTRHRPRLAKPASVLRNEWVGGPGKLARPHRKRGEISGLSEHFVDFRGMHFLGQDHLPRELLERD